MRQFSNADANAAIKKLKNQHYATAAKHLPVKKRFSAQNKNKIQTNKYKYNKCIYTCLYLCSESAVNSN